LAAKNRSAGLLCRRLLAGVIGMAICGAAGAGTDGAAGTAEIPGFSASGAAAEAQLEQRFDAD
jgi:hypothetical protein